MLKADRLFLKMFSMLVACVLLSCSDDKKSGEPGGAPPTDSPSSDCATDPEALIKVNDGEDTVPSWEALDCFTADLERLPQPAFVAGTLANLAKYSEDRTTQNLGWVMYSDIDEQHDSAVTNRSIWNNLNAVPPYVEQGTNTVYTFPLEPEWHEKKLRVAAAMLIAQKMKERYTTAVFFYPPSMDWTPFASTVTDFKKWYEDHFVPEKIVEAKTLERIKVEAYTPFPVELETWVENILPFGAATPIGEKVELAQWMIDTIVPQLREHFKGTITAHSYVNYELKGEEWSQLDFSAFDVVGFSYFPVCGGTPHETYIERQFENYLKVVEKSGNMPWGMFEIGPSADTWVENSCMTAAEFSAKEIEIYETLIAKMQAVTPAPIASGFAAEFSNPATKVAVETFVRSKIE